MGAWRAASSPGQGWLLLRPRPWGSVSLGQDPNVDPRTPGTAGAHDFLTGHAHEVLGASAARMSHGARPPPCHQGSPSCRQLTLPAGSQGGQPCARPSDTCPGAPSSRQQAGCTPGPPAGVCTGWWSVDLGVSFPSWDTGARSFPEQAGGPGPPTVPGLWGPRARPLAKQARVPAAESLGDVSPQAHSQRVPAGRGVCARGMEDPVLGEPRRARLVLPGRQGELVLRPRAGTQPLTLQLRNFQGLQHPRWHPRWLGYSS